MWGREVCSRPLSLFRSTILHCLTLERGPQCDDAWSDPLTSSYRERALKLLPHICAHCGREFEGRRLRELTVHHKDVDPTNNPPDGSNWELLCLYCHDHEHGRDAAAEAAARAGDAPATKRETSGLHQPFGGLADLLEKKKDDESS